MKLLIIGGTVFLGRHLVTAALVAGHEVTLFNRGRHNADLFPEVEKLRGDRKGDLSALVGREWDAVIDTCGYVPREVQTVADVLKQGVERYVFISTLSVYADFQTLGIDESYPTGKLGDEKTEKVTGESYGPLKALCEQAARAVFGERTLIVRPGLIVGPYDPTDRFSYWVQRVAAGGEVLAPAPSTHQVQFIDGRDLAEWTIRLVEVEQAGVFNATGPDYRLSLGELLNCVGQVSGSDAWIRWADAAFLLAEKVVPWSEMPLWVPDESFVGFGGMSVQKGIGAGLRFRPLAETVRDTMDWLGTRAADHRWRAGISREREEELLKLL